VIPVVQAESAAAPADAVSEIVAQDVPSESQVVPNN
jgi:hypothetical protein